MPPFTSKTAMRHTKKARGNPKAARAFGHAATSVYNETHDEPRAIRAGNAAAARSANKSSRGKRRSYRR